MVVITTFEPKVMVAVLEKALASLVETIKGTYMNKICHADKLTSFHSMPCVHYCLW